MSVNAIEVRGLSKRFTIVKREDKLKNLLVDLLHGHSRPPQTIQALKDVSFEVKKGEFFGVIGRNGSGKSTLLKVLAGVYSPNEGEVRVDGRLTPFIELGVGFNPDLTGRDNVFLNSALLGFSHKETEAMYDEIVRFAELERFMGQRLKNYSSGMQVRLAFSIAVQSQADILLIDEVLAVGDANFQQKCLQKFHEFKNQGKTIVFVSHSMEQIDKFCDRVMVLDGGKELFNGDTLLAIENYDLLNQERKLIMVTPDETVDETELGVYIKSVDVLSKQGAPSRIVHSGEPFSVQIEYHCDKEINGLQVSLEICEAESRLPLIGLNSQIDAIKAKFNRGNHTVRVTFNENILQKGHFFLVARLYVYERNKGKKTIIDVNNGDTLGNYLLVKNYGEKDVGTGMITIKRSWFCR